MATIIQSIYQIMELFKEMRSTFDLLNEKVETLEKIIEVNDSIQGKKIAALQSKLDQLIDGHVLSCDNGHLSYQHKVEIISRGIISTVNQNPQSELTIIKQDAERADK